MKGRQTIGVEIAQGDEGISPGLDLHLQRLRRFQAVGGDANRDGQRPSLARLDVEGDAPTFEMNRALDRKSVV